MGSFTRKFLLVLSIIMLVCIFGVLSACNSGSSDFPNNEIKSIYIVSFDSKGGTEIDSVKVSNGEKLTAPANPSRAMYVFSGWYKDALYMNVWDFDTDTVNSDITLYAKWQKEDVRITSLSGANIQGTEITLIVDDDVHEVDLSDKIVINNESATWKLYYDKLGQMEIPTKIATNTLGILGSGSNIFYIVVSSSDETQNKVYTLDIYKKYIVTIKVFYENKLVDSYEAKTAEKLPVSKWTRNGYSITTWESFPESCATLENNGTTLISFDNSDNSGFIPGDVIPKDCERKIILIPSCRPNSYKVTFDPNGGSLTKTTQQVTYDNVETLPIPQKEGYHFAGWKLGNYTVSDSFGHCTWRYSEDKTLTADWLGSRYLITMNLDDSSGGTIKTTGTVTGVNAYFDVNNSACGSEVSMQRITTSQGFTYPIVPEADGYIFTGWFCEPQCENAFDFNQNIVKDVTIYAGWREIGNNSKIIPTYSNYSDSNALSITVDSSEQRYYFSPQTTGTYKLRYKNSNSGANYEAALKLYNVSEKSLINSISSSSTSAEEYSFSATKGNVYYVQLRRSGNYDTEENICIYGGYSPSTKGRLTIAANTAIAVYGDEITLEAITNNGKTWVGWFENDKKLSDGTNNSFTFTMPASDKSFTAKWIDCGILYEKNIDEAGEVAFTSQRYAIGDDFTLIASSNNGYVWLGWYDGDAKVSDGKSHEYTFVLSETPKTYTAKWIDCSTLFERNIESAGSLTLPNGKYYIGDTVTASAQTNNGYTWLGWYDGDTKVSEGASYSYSFTMTETPKKYTAKWISCPVTIEKNIGSAGNVQGVEKTIMGEITTITADSNTGYTWLGWYDGDTKVSEGTGYSYSFTMTETSKTYTAKWIDCSTLFEKNIESAGSLILPAGKYIIGDTITVSAQTNSGYAWLGWFDGDTKVSENTSYSYSFTMTETPKTYTAKWLDCSLLFEKNIDEAGYLTLPDGKYLIGDEVVVTAATNSGFAWLGWYDEDSKVSEGTSYSYSFTMTETPKTYTARWIDCSLLFEQNIEEAGYLTLPDGKYLMGDEVTVRATTNSGFVWLGWYDGDTKVSDGTSYYYSFTMSETPKTYTAKWLDCSTLFEKNIDDAGSIATPSGKYIIGNTLTVRASTNLGYLWLGWYDGDTKVSDGTSYNYSFTMTENPKVYTAKWINYYELFQLNTECAGSLSIPSRRYVVGNTITVTAYTNSGFTWLGWYNGNDRVTENTSVSYTFELTESPKVYTAKHSYGTVLLEQNDKSAGTIIVSEENHNVGDNVTISVETNDGYTWLGWYDGDTKVSEGTSYSYSFTMTETPKTYTARWIDCSLLFEQNIEEAGYLTLPNGKYLMGDEVTVRATTNSGFVWLGWYNGNAKVSDGKSHEYTFVLSETPKTYTAKWIDCSTLFEKNIESAGSLILPNGKYYIGDTVTASAQTNNGYTWLGWYDVDTKVSEDASYSYSFTMTETSKTYTAKWIDCSTLFERNIESAGSLTLPNGKYYIGDTVTASAQTNNGYTWLGWYDGDTKVSEGASYSYSFTMTETPKKYTAKWISCPVTIEKNIRSAGNVQGVEKNIMGEITTITADSNDGYTWLGWYDGDTKVSEGASYSYSFTMTETPKIYTAKWEESAKIEYVLNGGENTDNPMYYETYLSSYVMKNPVKVTSETTINTKYLGNGNYRITKETTAYTFLGWFTESTFENEVTEITYTGSNVILYAKWSETTSTTTTTESAYQRDGNYIYFGTYPQTIKADNVSITSTTDSRGYYLGSDGEYYAKVTATPSNSGYKFSTGTTITNGTVYYFKVEPIRWKILSATNGVAFIVCDSIIANHRYAASSNNYANSEIRAWLNDTFYNTAFGALQQGIIEISNVDNSARSTNPDSNATQWNSGNNQYACANTNDKIFLLSEREVTTATYGFSSSYSSYDTARRKQTSDYSRATGAYMNTNTESRYYGNGWWWLRSPYYRNSYSARSVYDGGNADYDDSVSLTGFGVVPALRIKL